MFLFIFIFIQKNNCRDFSRNLFHVIINNQLWFNGNVLTLDDLIYNYECCVVCWSAHYLDNTVQAASVHLITNFIDKIKIPTHLPTVIVPH